MRKNAKSASSADLGRARLRMSSTGSPEEYDVPKSPRSAWLAQSRYCTTAGLVEAVLLVERVDRVLRGEAAQHVAPHVARQDLPEREDEHAQEDERDDVRGRDGERGTSASGGRFFHRIRIRSGRVGPENADGRHAAAWRPSVLPHAGRSGERCLAQVDLSELIGVVALDLRAAGIDRVVEVGEDDRRLIEQQQLDLLRDLALIGERSAPTNWLKSESYFLFLKCAAFQVPDFVLGTGLLVSAALSSTFGTPRWPQSVIVIGSFSHGMVVGVPV